MNRGLDPFERFDRLFAGNVRQSAAAPGMPLDLYREGETFYARIDLPGVDPSSIDIDVEDRTLTVRAERPTDAQDSAQWLVHERPTGTFARQLTLGYGVDLAKIEAEYADGVLTLTIPVSAENRARKISVAHKDSANTIEADAKSEADDAAEGENK